MVTFRGQPTAITSACPWASRHSSAQTFARPCLQTCTRLCARMPASTHACTLIVKAVTCERGSRVLTDGGICEHKSSGSGYLNLSVKLSYAAAASAASMWFCQVLSRLSLRLCILLQAMSVSTAAIAWCCAYLLAPCKDTQDVACGLNQHTLHGEVACQNAEV